MSEHETAEEKPEEAPAWAAFALAIVGPKYRPTVVAVLALAAFFGGAMWLDARAQSYIRDNARATVETVELRTTATEKRLDEQDERLRALEKTLAGMEADMRSLKDDVHELRASEERRHP